VSESLKHKTVKGVSWSFADNIANSGITFLVGLVLARLLTPEEYGIMGLLFLLPYPTRLLIVVFRVHLSVKQTCNQLIMILFSISI